MGIIIKRFKSVSNLLILCYLSVNVLELLEFFLKREFQIKFYIFHLLIYNQRLFDLKFIAEKPYTKMI